MPNLQKYLTIRNRAPVASPYGDAARTSREIRTPDTYGGRSSYSTGSPTHWLGYTKARP
ncbi:MAG: hypothetical protein KME30_24700 [Iphinoe sp. HA4291-MV1]|nr:hypothetical protein [Iphinoe sp. HA4291-MV1]